MEEKICECKKPGCRNSQRKGEPDQLHLTEKDTLLKLHVCVQLGDISELCTPRIVGLSPSKEEFNIQKTASSWFLTGLQLGPPGEHSAGL